MLNNREHGYSIKELLSCRQFPNEFESFQMNKQCSSLIVNNSNYLTSNNRFQALCCIQLFQSTSHHTALCNSFLYDFQTEEEWLRLAGSGPWPQVYCHATVHLELKISDLRKQTNQTLIRPCKLSNWGLSPMQPSAQRIYFYFIQTHSSLNLYCFKNRNRKERQVCMACSCKFPVTVFMSVSIR